jgi:hypothetical protein
MPNNAKSQYHKAYALRDQQEQATLYALSLYRAQPIGRDAIRKGYRVIASEATDYWNTTYPRETQGGKVKVNYQTLKRWDDGAISLTARREEQALLTPAEDELLTEFLIRSAERAFPLNNKRIREAVVSLVRRRHPIFQEDDIGGNWVNRYMARKSVKKKLGKYWTKSLKTTRANAVNATNHEEYFKLLEDLYAKCNFLPGNIYGGDESCFMTGQYCSIRVGDDGLPSTCNRCCGERDGCRRIWSENPASNPIR